MGPSSTTEHPQDLLFPEHFRISIRHSLGFGIVTERVPADMFDDARSHGSRPYDPAQHAVRPVERILTEA